MRTIPASELIINGDGSIFHLHVKPEQISDTVILVGDPSRVDLVASHFDSIECDITSREFHTITGMYKGKRLSCVSHGIGTDNIDIVATELDALVNVDFETRQVKEKHTTMTLVRIGTSGGLQTISHIGSYVASRRSLGFDGMLNYYELPEGTVDEAFEKSFMQHTNWNSRLATPYAVKANEELYNQIAFDMVAGVTISAPGFYGPQGRYVRAKLNDPELNAKIQSFSYAADYETPEVITNYEMESSALAGMGLLLGHKALTVCLIIAGRVAKNMNTDYKNNIDSLITVVLDRLV